MRYTRKLYRLLKRNNNDKNQVRIIKKTTQTTRKHYNKRQQILFKYTAPIPRLNDVSRMAMYIPGGFQYGARYPDIIIDTFDFQRAQTMLDTLESGDKEDKITDLVGKLLRLDKLISKDYNLFAIPPWIKKGIYPTLKMHKLQTCFDKHIFKCITNCEEARKEYPKSLTNITALPYIIGDCRESAWLTGFLCSIATGLNYRICYVTLYTVLDEEKTIYEFMDHVFTIRFYKGQMTIIDFIKQPRKNNIVLHNSHIKLIDNNVFKNYGIYYRNRPDIRNEIETIPVLEFGTINVGGIQKHRLIGVPKIYDGSMRFIKNPNNNINTFMLMNRVLPYSSVSNWNKDIDWCKE